MWKMSFNKPHRFRYWLYAVLLVCMIPAALTRDLSTMRTSISVIILPLFSAAGVIMIGRAAQQIGIGKRLYAAGAAAGIAASFGFVAYMYLFSASANGHQSSYALTEAVSKVRGYTGQYDSVFVENDTLIHSEVYVAAFTRMHPSEYQRAEKKVVDWNGWDNFVQLGKYRFPMSADVPLLTVDTAPESLRKLYITKRPLVGSRLMDSTRWNADRYYISDNVIGRR